MAVLVKGHAGRCLYWSVAVLVMAVTALCSAELSGSLSCQPGPTEKFPGQTAGGNASLLLLLFEVPFALACNQQCTGFGVRWPQA